MTPDPQIYDLGELSGLASVTPRTVRYYIQQGLLPAPGTTGPGAKYGEGHLDRLRLIRRLQQTHLPLAEIRRRLERLSDAEVREMLNREAEQVPGDPRSASDYARGVLRAMAPPDYSLLGSSIVPPASAPAAERSQWERIVLAPDLELHIRRPLSRASNKQVDRLLAYARRLLEEAP